MILPLLLLGAVQEPVSYEREVLPLLQARCAGCHRPDKAKGKLDLTTHASLLRGGRDGEVVVPGKPNASLLIGMVTPLEGEPAEMPPEDVGEPLSAAERDLLVRWIAEGAVNDSTATAIPSEPPRYARLPVVTDVAISPDGQWIAVTGRGEVLLHPAGKEGALRRLVGAAPRLESLAFSPDGTRLAVAGGHPGQRGEVQIWNLADDHLALSLPIAYDTLYGISWSGDGTRVAFGGPDNALRAIDATGGEQVLFQLSHEDWVLDTAWSTDDSHLVSVSRDRSMNLVQVSNQQFIDKITSITPGALKGGLIAVDRHPTRDELLIAGADGVPKIFRMYREKKRVIGDDYNLLKTLGGLEGRVYDACFSPDGTVIAAVSSHAGGGQVRLAKVEDGSTLWTRDLESGQYTVAFDPTGGRILAAGFDGQLRWFDLADGVLRSRFDAVPLEAETSQ